MPAKIDRTKRIVEKARRAVEQSAAATLTMQAQTAVMGGAGAGSPGGESIQDASGNMRWMWGVSEWIEGGGDVFSDG